MSGEVVPSQNVSARSDRRCCSSSPRETAAPIDVGGARTVGGHVSLRHQAGQKCLDRRVRPLVALSIQGGEDLANGALALSSQTTFRTACSVSLIGG